MNTQSNATPESFHANETQPLARAAGPGRALYWSIRRELWENRSLYIAPLAVTALILVGFLIGTIHAPARMRSAMMFSEHMQGPEAVEQPYDFAALLLMGTFLIVAVFYCLDALHGERRDRSILFWKSLPVSDSTTVLSKACIPLVVLPVLTWAITVVTQLLMLLLNTAVVLAKGQSVSVLWSHIPLISMSLMLLYHLLAMHGLYWAPFYAWMLLISGWARRAPLLWAALPLFAISILEKIAFNTSYFSAMLAARFSGGPASIEYPARNSAMEEMTLFTIGKFLISPSLWIGLAVAAAFLYAAVRLRRSRGPI